MVLRFDKQAPRRAHAIVLGANANVGDRAPATHTHTRRAKHGRGRKRRVREESDEQRRDLVAEEEEAEDTTCTPCRHEHQSNSSARSRSGKLEKKRRRPMKQLRGAAPTPSSARGADANVPPAIRVPPDASKQRRPIKSRDAAQQGAALPPQEQHLTGISSRKCNVRDISDFTLDSTDADAEPHTKRSTPNRAPTTDSPMECFSVESAATPFSPMMTDESPMTSIDESMMSVASDSSCRPLGRGTVSRLKKAFKSISHRVPSITATNSSTSSSTKAAAPAPISSVSHRCRRNSKSSSRSHSHSPELASASAADTAAAPRVEVLSPRTDASLAAPADASHTSSSSRSRRASHASAASPSPTASSHSRRSSRSATKHSAYSSYAGQEEEEEERKEAGGVASSARRHSHTASEDSPSLPPQEATEPLADSRRHPPSSSSMAMAGAAAGGQHPPPAQQRVQRLGVLRTCNGGNVYLGHLLPSKTKCVVKQIDNFSADPTTAEVIKNELNVHYYHLSQIPDLSTRIARMFHYSYDPNRDSVFLIIEFGEEGDLMSHVQNYSKMPGASDVDRERNAQKYFRQLMEGVKFLHDHRVAHRDIKLENLVLDRNYDLKIIDFGLSAIIGEEEKEEPRCTKRVGTPAWMPPEVFDIADCSRGYDPYLSDVWSCGVVLFTMLFGFPPFELAAREDLAFKYIINGQLRNLLGKWKVLDTVSNHAIEMLEAILVPADRRPSSADILQMPFITETLLDR